MRAEHREAPRPAGTWLIAALVALVSMATLVGAWPGAASTVEYDEGLLAAELLQLEDFPGMVIQGDRPSVRPFLRDTSTFAREIRDQLVMGSWSRAFIAPDFSHGVMVEAVEFRSSQAAKALLRPKGRPDGQPVALPPGAEARLLEGSESQVVRSTVLYIGRVAVNVEIFAFGPGAQEGSAALLSDVAFSQAARIGKRPDVGGESLSVSRMSVALLTTEIMILANAQLAIGAVTLVRDRSARQRLRQRVMRVGRAPLPYVVDVDAEAVGRLRQHARRAILRNAVAIGTLLVSFVVKLDLWQTAIAMVTALLVWSVVERRIGLRPNRPRAGIPRFHSWMFIPGLALLLAGAALLALGVLCFWMVAVEVAVGSPGADEETALVFRRFAFTVAVTALLLSVVPVALARRIAMRTLANDLRRDPRRRTTLLLRAFVDDRVRIRSRGVQEASLIERLASRRFERFEEVVARALAELGPVAAVSEPGVRLPPLGAVRETVEEGWQDRIAELIDNAPLIVVCLARTTSLAWEIRQLRARRAFCRTVFVLPPTHELDRRLRLRAFAQILGFDEDMLDLESPGRRVLAIVVTDAMEPVVLTSAAHDDVSYETAIYRAR